jgi:hypothetical protein
MSFQQLNARIEECVAGYIIDEGRMNKHIRQLTEPQYGNNILTCTVIDIPDNENIDKTMGNLINHAAANIIKTLPVLSANSFPPYYRVANRSTRQLEFNDTSYLRSQLEGMKKDWKSNHFQSLVTVHKMLSKVEQDPIRFRIFSEEEDKQQCFLLIDLITKDSAFLYYHID